MPRYNICLSVATVIEAPGNTCSTMASLIKLSKGVQSKDEPKTIKKSKSEILFIFNKNNWYYNSIAVVFQLLIIKY